MATVTEAELYTAVNSGIKFMTALETVNAAFTATGSPAFEAATAFPNSRSEKFLNLSGSGQYYTFDASSIPLASGCISTWIKPDFAQNTAIDCAVFELSKAAYDGNFHDLTLKFLNAQDDFNSVVYISGAEKASATSTGLTWSADSVNHLVVLWKETAALDGSKSLAIYFNNVLVATATVTWTTGAALLSTTAKLCADRSGTSNFDGGIFDWVYVPYDNLAASHTDAEIVQAFYSNTYNGGTAHKFSFELTDAPTVPTGCNITNIATTTCTVNWTDASSNETGFKVYQDGVLITTTAAGETHYDVTGLSPNTDYYFYVVAAGATSDSTASNTAYMTTTGTGITVQGTKGRLKTASITAVEWDDEGINYAKYSTKVITAAYTVDSWGPKDHTLFCSGTFAVTLPTATDGRELSIINYGSGQITLTGTINAVSNPKLDPGYAIILVGNGTNWYVKSIGATLV